MRLRNTSRYPLAEVRALVELGFSVARCGSEGIAVNVKNSERAYAGRAYHGVPRISSAHGKADYLVVLRIGAPGRFPVDNMVERVTWSGPWYTWEELNAPTEPRHGSGQRLRFRDSDDGTRQYQREVVARHPYGGKRSPLIVVNDWREALVVLAAHEGRHVYQFKHGKRCSESECERAAARALEAYRCRLLRTE